MDKFFIQVLSQSYEIEIDNENPEFLFFSVEDFGTDNKRFDDGKDVIKILYTGENRRAENYVCDYAITFDHRFEPWHYRLPLYAVEMGVVKEYPVDTLFRPTEITKRDLFCGFVHRNGNNQIRNEFFDLLSKEVAPVTSAGPLFNNTGSNVEGIKGKIDFFKRCSFALCFENSSHPGYVTEKILHAFYAGAIPIYYGSPTIARDFNENTFVDVGWLGPQRAIDKIKEIDNNCQLYEAMLRAPKTLYNIPNDCMIYQNLLNWFDAVVYPKKYGKRQ